MYTAHITSMSAYVNKNGKATLGISLTFDHPEEGRMSTRVHESLVGGALPITQRLIKALGVVDPADLSPAVGKEVTIRPATNPAPGGDAWEIVTDPVSTPEGVAALAAGW